MGQDSGILYIYTVCPVAPIFLKGGLMKRLGNNFDEWDREADRLQGMGLQPRALKGLDDQSYLYKNLQKTKWTGLTVGLLILGVMFVLFVFSLIAFG